MSVTQNGQNEIYERLSLSSTFNCVTIYPSWIHSKCSEFLFFLKQNLYQVSCFLAQSFSSQSFQDLFPDNHFWHNYTMSLQCRHNERSGDSIPWCLDYLLNLLFRRRLEKTSKLCVTGLVRGIIHRCTVVPLAKASNAENDFIWWRHHSLSWNWAIIVSGNGLSLARCQTINQNNADAAPIQPMGTSIRF